LQAWLNVGVTHGDARQRFADGTNVSTLECARPDPFAAAMPARGAAVRSLRAGSNNAGGSLDV
jgi:hypothetical protein